MVLATLITPGSTIFANPNKLPVIQVATDDATALATGLSVGRQSKVLFPDIEEQYDRFLASLINQRQVEQLYRVHLPSLFNSLSTAHQEEIQGVEASWTLVAESVLGDGQLSADEYRLINFLPDLGFMPNGSGFATIGKASKDNTPLIGRNLDWAQSPELQALQSITVYQGSEEALVNIGFAGLVSVVTGYNNHGLFLAALNAAPYSPYFQSSNTTPDHTDSIGFDLKTILTRKGNAKQAQKFLSAKRYQHSFNTMIADPKTVGVLEHSKNNLKQFRSWNSPVHASTPWNKRQQVATVDCFAQLKMPDNCQSARDLIRWKRFRELADFDFRKPASVSELSKVMTDTQNRRHEIFNENTLQSIIFQPNSGKLYLYANRVGKHSKTPVYQAYFDFTEALVKREQSQTSLINFKTLSWATLFLLSVMLWVYIRKQP